MNFFGIFLSGLISSRRGRSPFGITLCGMEREIIGQDMPPARSSLVINGVGNVFMTRLPI